MTCVLKCLAVTYTDVCDWLRNTSRKEKKGGGWTEMDRYVQSKHNKMLTFGRIKVVSTWVSTTLRKFSTSLCVWKFAKFSTCLCVWGKLCGEYVEISCSGDRRSKCDPALTISSWDVDVQVNCSDTHVTETCMVDEVLGRGKLTASQGCLSLKPSWLRTIWK